MPDTLFRHLSVRTGSIRRGNGCLSATYRRESRRARIGETATVGFTRSRPSALLMIRLGLYCFAGAFVFSPRDHPRPLGRLSNEG